MKKVIFFCVSLFTLSIAHAQQDDRIFKPFKVDISAGPAFPQGSGTQTGFLFVIEPRYAIIDQLSVGLRIEGAAVGRGLTSSNLGQTVSGDINESSSYLLTGDYYFSNKGFRPFAGAGLGIFSLSGIHVNNNSFTQNEVATSKFGGMIRLGFEASHFRLGFEYNFVGSTNEPDNSVYPPASFTSKNSYFGIKIGACIGGGRYNKTTN